MRAIPVTAILLAGLLVTATAGAAPPTAATTAPPASASSITTLPAVTVTGVVPGPGLWQVNRGDHVLWILGVVPTLPAGIEWHSREVEGAIAASGVVIEPPGVKLKVDTNWFGKLFLLPSIWRAQRNPDGKTLADVLPPAMYARWETARQRYFGNDRGIERYRPLLAAGKLLRQALRANNLRGDGQVTGKVAAIAELYHIKQERPEALLEIRDPRQAVHAFAASGPDGVGCLGLVLELVEHGLPNVRARANAWATGDIETLRKVPESAYRDSCRSAIMGAGFAKALGIDDLPARIEGHWLDAVDAALAANSRSFAVVPMQELLAPHGYLAALAARGYAITAPGAMFGENPASMTTSAPPAASSPPAPHAGH